jgi:serine phosphatase RsbU (regulator of sigma subunit)
VGGDYLDIVTEPDGSHLMVVADVAGKGMASALVCATFRSAFRALARQSLTLKELAARLGQQHWEEGDEARRRYVTAIFMRLDAESGEIEFVNAGHNPGILLTPGADGAFALKTIVASGTPLGMLPGMRYTAERVSFLPGARLLMYTDGLTEVFCDDEEFGEDRLGETFAASGAKTAEESLSRIWETLDEFMRHAHQQDDMTAIALHRLGGTTTDSAKETA